MRDALTGLANRRLLMSQLDRVLSNRRDSPTALLFIDLDAFKAINDTHGHEVGDQVLLETSDRILASIRAGDTVARLGGDEFVVLCERTSTAEAGAVGQRIVDAIRQPMEPGGIPLVVTASIGIADAGDLTTAEALLRGADVAMYRAKRSGRDQLSH